MYIAIWAPLILGIIIIIVKIMSERKLIEYQELDE